ncbi:bifunctional transaldolase/phosoglucose isomerase [Thermogemmatispora tikiterensis]|uniref:bifunctional transaldolase/phosoglucose isomerase n=1 Tax=Thermogemmatispora tikiterensis TaxID=1825093 RepID=UPI000DD7D362|nr:bifunctional transaldolase/phosoglucose isomerase [Thermogemmatispora tikiterensis]
MTAQQEPEPQFEAESALQELVRAGLEQLSAEDVARRIWERDASLWKSEPAVQQEIRERLGWLTVANTMQERLHEIEGLVEAVRQDGYRYAVLLGMGGSSLCPEVLRLTFGVAPGYLDLFVLDTTDPDTIRAVEERIDLSKTLFIVASKSGETIETLSHFRYFWHRVSERGDAGGAHFIAITDPGTSLERLAHDHHFRHVFANPPDIGGRYSALSFFGLVPGALIGLDIKQLLARAQAAMSRCSARQAADNPGLRLGAILGALGTHGRDKITFVLSPALASYGYWVEQLIAESTGKEGRGLLPVEGEALGAPAVYGDDRLFVYLRLEGDDNAALDEGLARLQAAGQPLVRFQLADRYDLGAQFFIWELATAVAGIFLRINAFDQPNVQESKDNTARLLERFRGEGKLPELEPVVSEGALRLYGRRMGEGKEDLDSYLQAFLDQVHPGDYIALMAYVQRSEVNESALQALRLRLRDRYRVATTLGYGPRFLHSTGQLHKGGPNNGVFIQITGDVKQDIAIPGEPYTFGILKEAQALGDLFALSAHQRRNIRIAIGGDLAAGLQALAQRLVPVEQQGDGQPAR